MRLLELGTRAQTAVSGIGTCSTNHSPTPRRPVSLLANTVCRSRETTNERRATPGLQRPSCTCTCACTARTRGWAIACTPVVSPHYPTKHNVCTPCSRLPAPTRLVISDDAPAASPTLYSQTGTHPTIGSLVAVGVPRACAVSSLHLSGPVRGLSACPPQWSAPCRPPFVGRWLALWRLLPLPPPTGRHPSALHTSSLSRLSPSASLLSSSPHPPFQSFLFAPKPSLCALFRQWRERPELSLRTSRLCSFGARHPLRSDSTAFHGCDSDTSDPTYVLLTSSSPPHSKVDSPITPLRRPRFPCLLRLCIHNTILDPRPGRIISYPTAHLALARANKTFPTSTTLPVRVRQRHPQAAHHWHVNSGCAIARRNAVASSSGRDIPIANQTIAHPFFCGPLSVGCFSPCPHTYSVSCVVRETFQRPVALP